MRGTLSTQKGPAREKALILYFSGTGNTWLAASEIADALRERGIATDLVALERATSTFPDSDYTLIGIGFPIYGCTSPMMVYDYVKKMPRVVRSRGAVRSGGAPGEVAAGSRMGPTSFRERGEGGGKKAFVFSTMGAVTYGSEAMIARMLSRKGYDVLAGRALVAPYNDRFLYVPEPDYPGAPHTEKKIRDLRMASRELVRDILEGKGRIERNTAVMIWASLAVQFLLKFFVPLLYICVPYLKFQAGIDCTSCGLCERICPKGNIRSSLARPRIGHRCEVCERCANFCPQVAVRFGMPLEFVQYRAPGYRPPFLRKPTGG